MPSPDSPRSTPSSQPPSFDPNQTWETLGLLAVFLIVNRFFGLRWAIVAASAWGIRSMVARKRRGSPIGKFLPLLLLYLLIRGGLGIYFDSEDVYFGIGIAGKALIGLGLLASIVINQPAMSRLLPIVFPFDEPTKAHPIYQSTMVRLTMIAGGYLLFSSLWDTWLLTNSSIEGFVVIRFLVGTVLGVVVFVGAFFYAQRRLDKIPGFEGLLTMLERMSVL